MKKYQELLICNARPEEHAAIGQLMVDVYAQLDGFPRQTDQPEYYQLLLDVGKFTEKPETDIIVAMAPEEELLGAVVYFGDMQYYGSGGIATQEKNAGGFRLLAVHPKARGLGIGKRLTLECIERAKAGYLRQVIIHTTKAMMNAWGMYEAMGFKRSPDLDFMQGALPVYGFRLPILPD